MRAIEAALAYTKRLGTRSMEVPEWTVDDKPLKIFWEPLTLEERQSLFKGGDLQLSDYVNVLALKALDADGAKMFDAEDKIKLRKYVESGVIIRIATKILESPKLDDLEKN